MKSRLYEISFGYAGQWIFNANEKADEVLINALVGHWDSGDCHLPIIGLHRIWRSLLHMLRIWRQFQGDLNRAFLEFRQGDIRCAKVGRDFYLFLAQTIEAEKEGQGYRLRTLKYAYRLMEGPTLDSNWLIRWEYESRKVRPGLHPRNHFHLNAWLDGFDGLYPLNCSDLHMPSGWVTIEEVIRFLIHELKIEPKSEDWDKRLCESEEQFRVWTSREV